MAKSARVYAFLIALAVLLAAIVVLGVRGGVLDFGVSSPPQEPRVDLIAYVGLDGQIRTVRPDGTDAEKISPDEGFFTWPMWSPDSTRIVFSGLPSDGEGSALTMYMYDVDDRERAIVYTNEPNMGPILTDMPHYPLWSPDSVHLSFMASVSLGLTLFVDDPEDDAEAGVALRRSPLYASWSADSRRLLVHAGIGLFVVDVEEGVEARDLGMQGTGFRAPAWWPLGNRMVFVNEDPPGYRGLYMTDVDTGERTLLAEIRTLEFAAFLWSPDGQSLAVARSEEPPGHVYYAVGLLSPEGRTQPAAIHDDVIAFYWSPDSTKIAYVTLTGRTGELRWMILNVEDGTRWPLVDFKPSNAQMTMFQFFDQFAYSHSVWSPDSDAIVFAGVLSSAEGVSASLRRQQRPQVYVVDVQESSIPGPIAEGFLAVWSPD